MTLYKFKALTEEEQLAAVSMFGVELAQRIENEYRIWLYQLDGFYVQVYHYLIDDKIKKHSCFFSPDFLTPWLDQIKIDNLF